MKRFEKANLLTYAAMFILGLVLIISRRSLTSHLFRFAGIGLLAVGALGIVGGWGLRSQRSGKIAGEFVAAIGLAAAGLWMLVNPGSVLSALNFVVGAGLIVFGIVKLLEDRRSGQGSNLLLDGGIVLLGALVIVFKLVPKLADWAFLASGIALIYTAVTGALSSLGRKI